MEGSREVKAGILFIAVIGLIGAGILLDVLPSNTGTEESNKVTTYSTDFTEIDYEQHEDFTDQFRRSEITVGNKTLKRYRGVNPHFNGWKVKGRHYSKSWIENKSGGIEVYEGIVSLTAGQKMSRTFKVDGVDKLTLHAANLNKIVRPTNVGCSNITISVLIDGEEAGILNIGNQYSYQNHTLELGDVEGSKDIEIVNNFLCYEPSHLGIDKLFLS